MKDFRSTINASKNTFHKVFCWFKKSGPSRKEGSPKQTYVTEYSKEGKEIGEYNKGPKEEPKVITIYVMPILILLAVVGGGGYIGWIKYKHHKKEVKKAAEQREQEELKKNQYQPTPSVNEQPVGPQPMNKVNKR